MRLPGWTARSLSSVGLLILAPNPILFIILIFGGLEAWHRWQHRNDPGMATYYSISRGKRVAVAVAYLGLIAVLARLGATADWRRIAEELWPFVDGPPSTALGKQEAEWRARCGR